MKKFLPILCLFLFSFAVQANAFSPVKILLVPGHDNEAFGAAYGNMKEADMTLDVATQIYNILKKDDRFDVYITRHSLGYTSTFADYFTNHREDIIFFKDNAKIERQIQITNGSFIEKENAPHVTVTEDIADRLYGFSKWSNDSGMDAMIHIHFNDYPRKQKWTIGKYTGFVIYVPEGQMANALESARLGANIFIQLAKKYIPSNYPPEKGGLVPDQKLIALGANGTLLPFVRSILIEYGYIYEKKFRTSSARLAAFDNMAELTARGIEEYFFPTP